MSAQRKLRPTSIKVRSRADALGEEAGAVRLVLLGCAALLVPVGLRAILLFGQELAPGTGDLRGLLSDAAAALAVAAVAGMFARLRGWLGVGLLLLWVLLSYGNYEHVRANGANMALRYAGYLTDATFLRGSALAATQPWLLAGALLATLGLGWAALRPGARVRLPTLVIPCALAVTALALWTESPETLGWRQTHFVTQNITWLTRGIPVRDSIEPSMHGESAPDLDEEFVPDLDGEPVVGFGDAKTNVLLVILEGVSGAYIEPIAAANERLPVGISMSELSRVARDHVVFTSFIAQQRQTNRGEYALLCGDLPRLVSAEAKMSELAARSDPHGGKRCLPAALAEAGYATVYLQAAPMTFMLKDRFMPKIGFERSIGDAYFEDAYSRSKWGVDDRTFLQQSLRMIEELRGEERPWFLTLLTAGTHHPQNVPATFLQDAKWDRRQRAFQYLDGAIGEFVAELEARGVLDDTLVLLTSDESQGLRGKAGDMQTRLSQSWGFLIAMLPGGAQLGVDTPQAQFDIALSTLDWLGLADYAHGFSGRSVFRRYANPRALVFGNTYFNRVGGLAADGQLLLCGEDLERCVRAATDEQRLFKRGVRPSYAASAGDLSSLRRSVAESLRISGSRSKADVEVASSAARNLRLIDGPAFQIRDDVDDLQWVFGGQYLSVPANSRIDVDLEVELLGEAGRIEVKHALKVDETNFFGEMIPDLRPGDRFHFRYSYSTVEPLSGLGNYLVVTRLDGSGLSIELPRAQMQIHSGSEISEPALEVHQFEIERASGLGDSSGATRH
ncbi:MAG: LTA synthase family protein [Deltaproteobacteria bacterium]|nr:LTA synthase family protein [Deltaproteobacteria bacterium]